MDRAKHGGKKGKTTAILLILCAALAAAILFVLGIYGFLAVDTMRVTADVLVVEGWIPDYALQAAVAEFRSGGYSFVCTSGLPAEDAEDPSSEASLADTCAQGLAELGLDAGIIIPCPAPSTRWNRTSTSARSVRRTLAERGIVPGGINVLTVGAHARQTLLSYRRILGAETQVGIITIPKEGFDALRWWSTGHGITMVFKCLMGWLKECLFGFRN